jgi:hypothetical protein
MHAPAEENPPTEPTSTYPPPLLEATPATTDARETTTESTPAATATVTDETAAETAAPVKEVTVSNDAAKVEATPASEGVLGYKGPGIFQLLTLSHITRHKLIIFPCGRFHFIKRFFWFSDGAVEPKHLTGYITSRKAEVAHPNAAWATQTGKGLLFYAHCAEDKSSPVGIFNLVSLGNNIIGDFVR